MPDRLLEGKAYCFLELIEIEACDIPDSCTFRSCTAILLSRSDGGLVCRAQRLLLGPKLFTHIEEGVYPLLEEGLLNQWKEIQITREQYGHVKRMIETDYGSIHPF